MGENEKKPNIDELRKEIETGKVLSKPDEKEMDEIVKNRQNRLRKIEDINKLYSDAKNMMSEITKGHIKLSTIPKEDQDASLLIKKHRMENIAKLKETIDLTSNLMKELKGKPTLKHLDKKDEEKYKAEKIKRNLNFENANKQLKLFGNLLDEIKFSSEKLKTLDPEVKEKIDKEKKERNEKFKNANLRLNTFGDILNEIHFTRKSLKKIDKKDLEEYKREKEKRFNEIIKTKEKINLATELLSEIAKDLKLKPIDEKNLRNELLVKFEVASSYLNKIGKEKAEKFENMAGLKGKMQNIKDIFSEMKSKSLKPIDEKEKDEINKVKSERSKNISEMKEKIKVKFDIISSLLSEIQKGSKLKHINLKEIKEIEAEKYLQRKEIQNLRNHIEIADELKKIVHEGLNLEKIDKGELKKQKEIQQKRLDDLKDIKGKVDVLEELTNKIINKGFKLVKVTSDQLEDYEIRKKGRLEEIKVLKDKLKKIDLWKE